MNTNPDCCYLNKTFDIKEFKTFSSEQLSIIVGKQSPNEYAEDLSNYRWSFKYIDTEKLKYATEYYEEPEGGWSNVYIKFLEEDAKAAIHTPECAGRDDWIKNEWTVCTDTYPLFVIVEGNDYRLLDGHHRLAGAFYYKLKKVAVILGVIE